MTIKDKWVNMRLTEKEKREIQRAAKRCGRSVSNYLMWLHQKDRGRKTWNAQVK